MVVVDELFADNFVFNYAPPEVAPDQEAYRQVITMYHTYRGLDSNQRPVGYEPTKRYTKRGGSPIAGKLTFFLRLHLIL